MTRTTNVKVEFLSEGASQTLYYTKKFMGDELAGAYLVERDARNRYPNATKISVEVVK